MMQADCGSDTARLARVGGKSCKTTFHSTKPEARIGSFIELCYLMDEGNVLGDGAAAPLAKLRQYPVGLQLWR